MKRFFRYAAVGLATALLAPRAPAQVPQAEQGITRQQADEILNELRSIRQLLQNGGAQPAEAAKPAANTKLNMKGAQVLGDPKAPLTIVEFTDYQCTFCQRFHETTFGDLKKNYIDTGKVRFFSRDMPLEFHRDAMRAAQAGRCAAEQKRFWELRDIMSANPDRLDLANILAFAAQLKMDGAAFRTCIESGKYKNAVQTDVMDAMRIGVGGTPSFVLGRSTPDGVEGEILEGALPFSEFDSRLKALLR